MVSLAGATDPDGDPVTTRDRWSHAGRTGQEPPRPHRPDAVSKATECWVSVPERDQRGDGRVYRIAFTALRRPWWLLLGTGPCPCRARSASPRWIRRRRATTRSQSRRSAAYSSAAMLLAADTVRSLHLIGAAVWAGGMVMLALAVGAARRRLPSTSGSRCSVRSGGGSRSRRDRDVVLIATGPTWLGTGSAPSATCSTPTTGSGCW